MHPKGQRKGDEVGNLTFCFRIDACVLCDLVLFLNPPEFSFLVCQSFHLVLMHVKWKVRYRNTSKALPLQGEDFFGVLGNRVVEEEVPPREA